MSNAYDALTWSIRVSKGLDPRARLLLICGLAPRVNDANGFIVWPSKKQLADDCDMSMASVRRWMKTLVDEGLVEATETTRENGSQTSNRYRLMVRTDYYHPRKGKVEVRVGGVQADTPPQVKLKRGGRQADTPRGGQADTPMNLSNRTDSNELLNDYDASETDLFGEPVKSAEQIQAERRLETVRLIETEWARLCDDVPAVRRLVGNKLDDARVEKAMSVAAKFAGEDGDVRPIWTQVFREIRSSRWLCGEKPPVDDRPPFKLQLTWLLENRNFTKVAEGKYGDGRDPDVADGGKPDARRSPAGQVAARVFDRFSARGSGSAGGGNQELAVRG